MVVGRIVHYAADVVLVSAFLAGVKRNTGLAPDVGSIQNKDIQYYAGKYFDLGETVYDYSVAYINSSGYFKRR